MNAKESKWIEECKAVGLMWLGKVDGRYSKCSCNVCGHVDNYQQTNIRHGNVKCSNCQITKYKTAVKDAWSFIDHFCENRQTFVNIKHKCCDGLVKVVLSNFLKGKYDCPNCQITKYQQSAKQGWTFENHFCENRQTYVNLKHHCCDGLVKVHASHYLKGAYDCPHCQITKYQQSAKRDWSFIDHFSDGSDTFVNLKHKCCDDLVKVRVSKFLKGSYDCPHCSHTHYSDPSYFYAIQVGSIIKLGISNRPDERYTQYGLLDDASIIEHLRIPLESKRDALVVESYAKQLVKEFKIPTDISKQVFTKSGYNECYSIESLDHLLAI